MHKAWINGGMKLAKRGVCAAILPVQHFRSHLMKE